MSDAWQFWILISQWCFYLGTITCCGGLINYYFLQRDFSLPFPWRAYLIAGAIVGALASVIVFLLKVGDIAESGIAGIIDPVFFPILAKSSVGIATLMRLVGLTGMGIAALLLKPHASTSFKLLSGLIGIASIGLLLTSFAITGHTSELSLSAQVLISLHLATAIFWLGALAPLWAACHQLSTTQLTLTMRRFSSAAVWLVGILVLAGVLIAVQLVPTLSALWNTSYGRLLVFKVACVVVLLGLATANKFVWTTSIERGNVKPMRISIGLEIIVGVLILFITAFLASTASPQHL